MTVCPALLPPWLRTTMSALAVSTSMIFPFPSSPHCAPIRIVFAIENWNQRWAKNFPEASTRTHSGLPTNNMLAVRACKRFSVKRRLCLTGKNSPRRLGASSTRNFVAHKFECRSRHRHGFERPNQTTCGPVLISLRAIGHAPEEFRRLTFVPKLAENYSFAQTPSQGRGDGV